MQSGEGERIQAAPMSVSCVQRLRLLRQSSGAWVDLIIRLLREAGASHGGEDDRGGKGDRSQAHQCLHKSVYGRLARGLPARDEKAVRAVVAGREEAARTGGTSETHGDLFRDHG